MKNVPVTPRILRFLLVVLFLLPPCLTFAGDPTPTTTDSAYGAMKFEAGEIIVKFKDGIPQAIVQSLLLGEGMSILYEMDNLGLMLLSVPKGRELEKIEELKRNPVVEYAEANYAVQIADTTAAESHYNLRAPDVSPNDRFFPAQWNLHKIEAPAAWEITTGSDEVVIAVIGTGVDLDHPELRNKIWTNPGEIPDNEIDDDGNGYVDDVHGWDFADDDNEPQDYHWHGTFVATVAAAETNNGLETAGVSGGGEIMPLVTDGTPVLLETSLGSSKVAATTVEFQPGPPYTVTLAAHPTSLTVGETSTLTATVKDQDDNNVADGTVVTFETSLGGLGSTTVTQTTASGVATATLTSQVAGTAVITATSDSKYDTANVTFNPGLPYTLTVEANPTSISIRWFTSTITAAVKDQYDNPVADGTVVTFTTDLGSLGFDSSSVVETIANGVATTILESGVRSGTAYVTATADSAVGQTQVIFLWDGGIAGVSWGAKIMPVKVLPRGDYIGEGIKYAADNGARVMILAFQLTGYNEAVEAQITEAYEKGALLVAGAGNCGGGGEGCNGINPVMYPAALPYVLAVAATSQSDGHLFFSEYHPYVDVAAPGERIPGFGLKDSYGLSAGTEYAAAQAAGLAALMWSVNPTLTNDEVEGIIKSTAVDLDEPCKDYYLGYGRIDADAAVRAALHYLHVEPSILEFRVYDCINPPLHTLTSASPCTWSVTATAPWLSISSSEGYTTTVSINTDSLPDYGVHCGTITATSTLTNGMDYSQTIPVTYAPCWRSYLPLLLKNHGSD